MTFFNASTARHVLVDKSGNVCLTCERMPGGSTVRISRDDLLWLHSLPYGDKYVELQPKGSHATYVTLDDLVKRYGFTTDRHGTQYMYLGQSDLWGWNW